MSPHPASFVSPSSVRTPRGGSPRRARAASAAPRLSAARAEIARLRAHFRAVITELGRRDVSHLAPPQRAARASLIGVLARYARRGRFPRNLDFRDRQMPYFIDALGTRCAMAHLIEHTGASAFVQRIAAQQNNAFIAEIEHDPELVAWLAQAGLTAAEAARIQPSYPQRCDIPLADLCACTYRTTIDGPLLETVVTQIEGTEQLHATVTAIHWQEQMPSPEVAANMKVGMEIVTWTGAPAAVGDTVLVFANDDDPSAAEYGVGPGLLFREGVAQLGCMHDTPDLATKDAVAAFIASNGACMETLAAKDSRWAEPKCDGGGGGCSIGHEAGISLALPGVLGLAALVWAARRRTSRHAPRRP